MTPHRIHRDTFSLLLVSGRVGHPVWECSTALIPNVLLPLIDKAEGRSLNAGVLHAQLSVSVHYGCDKVFGPADVNAARTSDFLTAFDWRTIRVSVRPVDVEVIRVADPSAVVKAIEVSHMVEIHDVKLEFVRARHSIPVGRDLDVNLLAVKLLSLL